MLLTLLGMTADSPVSICARGFPTRIDIDLAAQEVSPEDLDWLVRNSVLRHDDESYGLVDEFLRIRLMFDREERETRAMAGMNAINLTELRASEDELGALDPGLLQLPDFGSEAP